MKRIAVGGAVAMLAACAMAEGRVSVTCPTESIDEYRELAKYAKSIGATHLDACQVIPSFWQWDADRTDPYPNWSMVRPCVTKFVVHPKLKKYIPADYVAKNMANLKARAAILKEYGFKSSFWGFEPAFLPEQAYVDHPEWRGARCDQPRRARHEYYAPCTDNPEVREMYVEMVAELCKVCPFEAFLFRVNDSGSGLCWTLHQYPGANGPMGCHDKDYAQRVVDFMSLFQEGAAKAGLPDVRVNSRMNLGPYQEPGVIAKLKPGQSVNNRTASGAAGQYAIGYPNRFFDFTVPVVGLPRIVAIAKQIQIAQQHPGADVNIGLRSMEEEDTKVLLGKYLHRPIGNGPAAIAQAVEAVAAEFVGEAHKCELAEALYELEDAVSHLGDAFNRGGHIFLLGSVHQRWVTRPLVYFPEELQEDERSYWRNFIFQAQSENEANNMLDLQGTCWLDGYGAKRFVELLAEKELFPRIDRALKGFMAMVPFAVNDRAREYLTALVDRTEFYRCLVRNAQDTVSFQFYLDTIDRTMPPYDTLLEHSMQGDPRTYELELISRREIDNCQEMINILKRAKRPVVQMTPTIEEESIMTFGPNLVQQLEKKISIMQRHRRDIRRLLPCKNP